ncbi:MAG: outer membrane beta-barrel domain-containing protein [Desulfuromonadales bacterium]|nr:MAG: outer membrane beta-barrel domain-containing protein [Desulfuromonadales bacterium]
MKRTVLPCLVALSVVAASGAHAEMRKGAVSISPFVGGYTFEGDQNLKGKPTFGIRAGYGLTKSLGLEGVFGFTPTEESKGRNLDVDSYTYRLEGLYHFMTDSSFVPFLAVGAGGITQNFSDGSRYDDRNGFIATYGGGVKYFLAEDVALRGDVRGIVDINNPYNNVEYTLGLTYQFGGERAVVKAAPLDSDGDGVIDSLDKCPGTPKGVKVDKDGCPLDTDGDGVPDYLDKCPGTPAGVKVDSVGCPLDTDGDGVPDYLDKCPDTPAGVKVDSVGCPLDTDGDGVPDYLDKCPGTPAGVKVDSVGCPLDSDGDGVPDYLDKCPGTPAGVKVDKVGCPIDTDGDGVPDYLDKCPDTPKGAAVDKNGCPERLLITLLVEFDFDKAVVKPEFDDELKKLSDFMKEHPDATAVLEGYTDNVGSDNYNQKLSEQRAEAVKKYLVDKFGISAKRLSAKGFGEKNPVASNDTEEGRYKNRRVVANIDSGWKKKKK